MRCIYCLSDLAADKFNTEHVIPRAFGTFEQNLTLNDAVCAECNNDFSKSLELFFARDSFEAYDRVKQGLKSVEEVEGFPQDRLTFSAAVEGEWCGLRLRLSGQGDGPVVGLVPQVGIRSKGDSDWIYLTEEEIRDPEKPLPDAIADEGIRIIAPTDDSVEHLINILSQRGIDFQKKGTLATPKFETDDIEIYVNTKIDSVIKRCAAKIVFNYLAYTAGRKFVLHGAFDVTRNYIRYNRCPEYQLTNVDDMPILADDARSLRQTDGHLITVNWTADKKHVVGQLSLFNRVTYRISLAIDFSGIWRPIRSGHLFDLKSRRITLLDATSLILYRSFKVG